MTKIKIQEKLEEIKSQGTLDDGFLDTLIKSNDAEEDSFSTAEKIVEQIKKRYVKNKEN